MFAPGTIHGKSRGDWQLTAAAREILFRSPGIRATGHYPVAAVDDGRSLNLNNPHYFIWLQQ